MLVSLGSLFFMCIWHGSLAVMPLSHESSKYIDNRVIAGFGGALLLALLVITLWIYFVVRSPSKSKSKLSLFHHQLRPSPLCFPRASFALQIARAGHAPSARDEAARRGLRGTLHLHTSSAAPHSSIAASHVCARRTICAASSTGR